jgi:exopolyphosphatase/guanosine-5'-triphosphate,3'-diphosphate pyrophosphatase
MVWTDGSTPRERSGPEGAVTISESFLKTDPPAAAELQLLRAAVEERLLAGFRQLQATSCILTPRLIGIGGTVTTLAAIFQGLEVYDAARVHGYCIERKALESLLQSMAAMSLAERRKLAGLPPDRADIILGGGTILAVVMSGLGFETCTASVTGLLHAALRTAALEALKAGR